MSPGGFALTIGPQSHDPSNARSVADHPRRISRDAGRALSAVDSRRAGRLLGPRCILAKERAGCVSLWSAEAWESKLDSRIKLIEQKILADAIGEDRIARVQLLGRLLSTRHKAVELKGRGRLLCPRVSAGFSASTAIRRTTKSWWLVRPCAWRFGSRPPG